MTYGTEALRRFLRPSSVAVVGASERQERSNNAVLSMRAAGIDLFYVNPNRPQAYGERTYPDLVSLPAPVDAVLSLVPAAAAVEVAADARKSGAGGLVVVAGGFAEAGGDGGPLQERLRAAAGDMPVLGPNCNGFVTPSSGARLSGVPRAIGFPKGSIGVVTHSGALLGALGVAAAERVIGYSCLVSTGNEMSLDMADALEFLVDDEDTKVIALVVEGVRDPDRFLAAVRRATAHGKPVVALKLGRSARGQEIATSHTGALAGEARVYEAVFRQYGIGVAGDLVDLLDRLALVAQLPPRRWTRAAGLAVTSLSGGWSAMTSDVCAEEGVELPPLTDLRDRINTVLPERTTVNPLDMTGFVMGRADVVRDVLDTVGGSPQVDAVMLQWIIAEAGGESGAAFVDAAVETAARLDKPVIIGSVEDGHPGQWARELPERGVAVGRGLRATLRGLRTMGDFTRYAERSDGAEAADPAPPVARPAVTPVDTSVGRILPFDAAMDLLSRHGVPTAPYALVEPGAAPPDGFGFAPPFVVKLADVPHRSELGAVRTGVGRAEVADAVAELRETARRSGVPERVVVQPQLGIHGEAFVGAQGDGGLGPYVVFGVGGIFVELLGQVAGRLAPFDRAEAGRMVDEFTGTGVLDGARGRTPWDRERLLDILVGVGRLAAGSRGWLRSLDVNPLVVTPDGQYVAVDALCVLDDAPTG